VLLQFLIVVVGLLLIVMAVFDFGNAFTEQSALRETTKDVAQAASTNDLGVLSGSASCTTTGTSIPSATASLVCLLHNRLGLPDDSVRVMVALPDGNDASGDRIVVCSMHEVHSVTGVFSEFLSGRIETARAVAPARREAGIVAGGEDPFPHRDWSFCTA
jgi:hypothetical protein